MYQALSALETQQQDKLGAYVLGGSPAGGPQADRIIMTCHGVLGQEK